MSDRILKAGDVADLLRLNVETVYSLIRRDGLPAARVGSQWRFSEAKIRLWLEARQVAVAETASTEGPGTGGAASQPQ